MDDGTDGGSTGGSRDCCAHLKQNPRTALWIGVGVLVVAGLIAALVVAVCVFPSPFLRVPLTPLPVLRLTEPLEPE